MGPACWFRSSERLTPMIEPGRVSRLGTSEGELVKVPFGRADEAGGGAFPGRLPQLPTHGSMPGQFPADGSIQILETLLETL